jgi:hypothetical protein
LGIFWVSKPGGFFTGEDKQAQESIGLGGIIGILGVAGIGKIAGGGKIGLGERRKEEQDLKARVDSYEKNRKEFLSFQNLYDVDEQGNMSLNEDRAQAMLDGIYKGISKQEAISKVQDPLFKQYLASDFLASYVFAAKAAGVMDKVSSVLKPSLARVPKN